MSAIIMVCGVIGKVLSAAQAGTDINIFEEK
jgi:hypothetical protein